MVYRVTLSYRGEGYAGWQRQNNAVGVQQRVEEALEQLVGYPVRIFAAGRTDAGVHALGQVAHFTLERPFALTGLVHGTNHLLRSDIRILMAARMSEGFHARKSALGKEYVYRLYRGRVVPPTVAWGATQVLRSVDVNRMRMAMRFLPGRHDFSAFALAGGSHQQPFRRLFGASLEEHGREVHFRFTGEGFLRGMVRGLAGTLVEIGLGRREPEDMARLLTGRPRSEAGPTAAAHGLCLVQVFYPPCWLPIEAYEL